MSIASGWDWRWDGVDSALRSMRKPASICAASAIGSETLPSDVRRGLRRVYQGCWRSWAKEKRLFASMFIMPRSNDRASAGNLPQSESVLRPLVRTYSWNSQLPEVGSSHGVLPTSKTNRMTPHDQISTRSAE